MAIKEVQLKNGSGDELFPLACGVHQITKYDSLVTFVVPHTVTSTSSSNSPTLWSATGGTYTVVPGKTYLAITSFTVGENHGSFKGTAEIQPYKSGSSSTTISRSVKLEKKQGFTSISVGNTYYMYEIFQSTLETNQTAYNKVVQNGAGSVSRTYDLSFSYFCVFECDDLETAQAIAARMADITQDGLTIDRDIIDEINDRLDTDEANITSLDNRVTAIEGEKNYDIIECWGDSQTEGVSGGTSWVTLLAPMIGYELGGSGEHAILNYGNGGETAREICVRYGSLPIYLNPVTIPAGTTQQACTIYSDTGETFGNLGTHWGSFNPVTVDGNEYNIRTDSGNNKTIAGTSSGSAAYEVLRPTRIIPGGARLKKNKIMIVQMGQNGTIPSAEYYMNLVDAMIALMPTPNPRYIVIPPIGNTWISDIDNCEKEFARRYGKHWLNVRKYLIDYGLEDNELEPTAQDLTDIANGAVPHSLCVDFNIHLNTYGTTSQAKCVKKRLEELGYLITITE